MCKIQRLVLSSLFVQSWKALLRHKYVESTLKRKSPTKYEAKGETRVITWCGKSLEA